jgi:hypothetical protein
MFLDDHTASMFAIDPPGMKRNNKWATIDHVSPFPENECSGWQNWNVISSYQLPMAN